MEQMAYTAKEFQTAFRMDAHRFYDEVHSGRLRTYKVGRKHMVAADAAREWQTLMESMRPEIRPAVFPGRRKEMTEAEKAFKAAQLPLPIDEKIGVAMPPLESNDVVKALAAGPLIGDGMPVKRGPGRPRKTIAGVDAQVVRELRRSAETGRGRAWPWDEKKPRSVPGS